MSSDHELVQGIAGRDPEAFRTLLERYAVPVTNVAYRLLDNRPDAEEIAQEVFLRLYRHPPRLEPSARLFTWLYRVTVNLCLDEFRRRKRTPATLSLEASGPGAEAWAHGPVRGGDLEGEGRTLGERLPDSKRVTPREEVARAELAAATRRAVASLPEPLRVPLALSIGQELSHAQIAQVMGLSSKAVERRIYRAREILRSRLRPYL